jgi:hypothetical protein
MLLFACTFPGLATMYIEAPTEEEAKEKAWDRLLKSNDAPDGPGLTVIKIN